MLVFQLLSSPPHDLGCLTALDVLLTQLQVTNLLAAGSIRKFLSHILSFLFRPRVSVSQSLPQSYPSGLIQNI